MNLFFRTIPAYVLIAIFFLVTVIGCSTMPVVKDDRSSTVDRVALAESMSRIVEGVERLTDPDYSTYSAFKLMRSGNPGEGSARAIGIIKKRIGLEEYLIDEIDKAEAEYSVIARKDLAENKQIQQICNDLEAELADKVKEVNREIDEFKEVIGIENFDSFSNMARGHAKVIKAIRKKRVDSIPEIANFLEKCSALIQLLYVVDKAQLVLLDRVVQILDLKDPPIDEIEEVMRELGMRNLLTVIKGQKVDTGNIVEALNVSFEESVAPLLPPVSPRPDTFNIAIKPDRGRGGIYHEGDEIYFTIRASHDCWFILRTRNSSGMEKQLLPNEYFKEANFLRANTPLTIPSDDMDFDYIARKPPDLQVIEVIASRRRIYYDPVLDMEDQGKYRGPSRLKEKMKTRDIDIQPRYVSLLVGGSYDNQYYSPDEAGSALIATTYISIARDEI